ncbi:unnamed protein product [Orchesella dallaii]|uniref:CCHC-type domain-containing protein n=1 Tax=Orchesella dallaii TaxID=48710 RepID=A0ABP1QR68_9HEXA
MSSKSDHTRKSRRLRKLKPEYEQKQLIFSRKKRSRTLSEISSSDSDTDTDNVEYTRSKDTASPDITDTEKQEASKTPEYTYNTETNQRELLLPEDPATCAEIIAQGYIPNQEPSNSDEEPKQSPGKANTSPLTKIVALIPNSIKRLRDNYSTQSPTRTVSGPTQTADVFISQASGPNTPNKPNRISPLSSSFTKHSVRELQITQSSSSSSESSSTEESSKEQTETAENQTKPQEITSETSNIQEEDGAETGRYCCPQNTQNKVCLDPTSPIAHCSNSIPPCPKAQSEELETPKQTQELQNQSKTPENEINSADKVPKLIEICDYILDKVRKQINSTKHHEETPKRPKNRGSLKPTTSKDHELINRITEEINAINKSAHTPQEVISDTSSSHLDVPDVTPQYFQPAGRRKLSLGQPLSHPPLTTTENKSENEATDRDNTTLIDNNPEAINSEQEQQEQTLPRETTTQSQAEIDDLEDQEVEPPLSTRSQEEDSSYGNSVFDDTEDEEQEELEKDEEPTNNPEINSKQQTDSTTQTQPEPNKSYFHYPFAQIQLAQDQHIESSNQRVLDNLAVPQYWQAADKGTNTEHILLERQHQETRETQTQPISQQRTTTKDKHNLTIKHDRESESSEIEFEQVESDEEYFIRGFPRTSLIQDNKLLDPEQNMTSSNEMMPKYSIALNENAVKLFIRSFNLWGNMKGLSESSKKFFFPLCFVNSEASKWFLLNTSLQEDKSISFDQMCEKFLEDAPMEFARDKNLHDLLKEEPKPTESASSYLLRIRFAAGDEWNTMTESRIVDALCNNLPNSLAAFIDVRGRPDQFDELKTLVRAYERKTDSRLQSRDSLRPAREEAGINALAAKVSDENQITKVLEVLVSEIAALNNKKDQDTSSGRQDTESALIRGIEGNNRHMVTRNPEPENRNRETQNSSRQEQENRNDVQQRQENDRNNRMVCYYCNKLGHRKSDCRSKKYDEQNRQPRGSNPNRNYQVGQPRQNSYQNRGQYYPRQQYQQQGRPTYPPQNYQNQQNNRYLNVGRPTVHFQPQNQNQGN